MTEDGRERFVGVDVGRDRLDVHIRPEGQHFVVVNDEAGLAELVARLEALAPRLIVLEASGGYERPAALAREPGVGGGVPARVLPHGRLPGLPGAEARRGCRPLATVGGPGAGLLVSRHRET